VHLGSVVPHAKSSFSRSFPCTLEQATRDKFYLFSRVAAIQFGFLNCTGDDATPSSSYIMGKEPLFSTGFKVLHRKPQKALLSQHKDSQTVDCWKANPNKQV
jgi:hypothetical protein